MPIEIKEIVIRAEITTTNTPPSSEELSSNFQSTENLFTDESIELIRTICQQELEKQERAKNSHHRSDKFLR